MKKEEKYLKLFDYKLPEELIAKAPASPRENARLLVYDRKTKKIYFNRFRNIANYLPINSVLVFNETKVIPARLTVKKPTSGRARVLFVGKSEKGLKFLSDRKLILDSIVRLNKKIYFQVKANSSGEYLLKPSFNKSRVYEVLRRYGETPIPPYIKDSPLKESDLKKKYQSVFARVDGSVAAPTASLHFTKNLIKQIKSAGIGVSYITLHVNQGTFAPITEENLKTNRLHQEFFEINPKTAAFLNKAKKEKRPIIPVGTTSLRTLESAAKNGQLRKLKGETDLFIRGKYNFRFADGLVTNFHVPKSSLLMLVSSLAGRKEILKIYRSAIREKFRLFSFGDGMLIL